MRKLRYAGMIVAVAGLYALNAESPVCAGSKSDSEVKIAYKASKIEGGKQTITITMTVNAGWYIYANPVGDEQLAAAATTITVKGKEKPQEVKVGYPKGKAKEDTVGKEVIKYSIYEEKVEIPINVHRAQGDTDPLEVSVRFMACNKKGVCLQPATVKLKVE
jgi:DsbC/DsbD-like thiol-disulfide interchange protein